jgi:hypothetical protein
MAVGTIDNRQRDPDCINADVAYASGRHSYGLTRIKS